MAHHGSHHGSRLVRHGKYKRLTFEALAAADKDYVCWCLRAQGLPSSLRDFARYVKERHGGIPMAGKHKHMFLQTSSNSTPTTRHLARAHAQRATFE